MLNKYFKYSRVIYQNKYFLRSLWNRTLEGSVYSFSGFIFTHLISENLLNVVCIFENEYGLIVLRCETCIDDKAIFGNTYF